MSVEYRCARDSEMAEYFLSGRLGFGQSTAQSEIEGDLALGFIRPEWTLCAFDDGVLASKMATLPLEVYWGGRVLPCGGVTAVTTLPSHRRRGHVRNLMTRAFGNMRDAGQPIAMLWASMAAIYQRFGFGMAFATRTCTFDARQLRFIEEVTYPGRIRILPNSDAEAVTSGAYDRFATRRTTALKRDAAWRARLTRELDRRGDNSRPPMLVAAYEEAGDILGYVVYEVEHSPPRRLAPRDRILVHELVWLSPVAHRALFRYLAEYDLVATVWIRLLAADDPLFYSVEDPRLLGLSLSDGAFLRVVDVRAALEGRGYDSSGRLRMQLEDAICPWNNGGWDLEVENGTAHVRPSTSEPALTLTPRSLAMLITGFQSATALGRMGLLSSADGEALREADSLFRTSHAPVCLDHF